jgi:hypothetical protein
MDRDAFLLILKQYQKEGPTNLIALARELQLGVYSSPMLNPAISGKLIRIKTEDAKKFDKGSGWYLLMNRDRPMGAIKESLAYLIAKFVLTDLSHYNLLSDSVRFRTMSALEDPLEKQIDTLALEILIPDTYFAQAIKKGKYIHEIPDLFKVDASTLSAKVGYTVYPLDFWVNARSSTRL